MNHSSKLPFHILVSLLSAVGLLLCLAGPVVMAQSARLLGAAVAVDPSSVQVAVGSTVFVSIRIENVANLDYADVLVKFDPSLLEATQIDPGTVLSTVESKSIVQDSGEVYLELSGGPANGSGVLGTITFRGKAAGTSDITVDESWLYLEDTAGNEIFRDIHNGSITVISGTALAAATRTPTPSPSPTPTDTPTPGPSPTPTFTPTPGPSPTPTMTPTPGASPLATPAPETVTPSAPTPETVTPSAPTPTPELVAPSPTPAAVVLPTSPAEAGNLHTWQVWADRIAGAASGSLEGPAVEAGLLVLPFGACNTSTGAAVWARSYLHFPLNVFPPGTDVRRATLYVYVDGSSSTGEAKFGAYRVLEQWTQTNLGADPAAWPDLLASPMAVTMAHLGVTSSKLEATSSASPLPTPTLLPPTSLHGAQAVVLGEVEGVWLTWDVTALLRAWLAQEVPDHGLALAANPVSNADPAPAGNMLVAGWFAPDELKMKPYVVAEFEVHPVTPTPVPFLPYAGKQEGWGMAGLLLVGVALLLVGLAVRRK